MMIGVGNVQHAVIVYSDADRVAQLNGSGCPIGAETRHTWARHRSDHARGVDLENPATPLANVKIALTVLGQRFGAAACANLTWIVAGQRAERVKRSGPLCRAGYHGNKRGREELL